MKRVIWTPTARKSLQETYDFVFEMWNEEIADKFLNQLDYRILQIQRNPKLAPSFIDSVFRKLLIHKSVSLFYRIDSDYIKILLVWDNRQNPENLLHKLTDV